MAIDVFSVGVNAPIEPLSDQLRMSAQKLTYAASDSMNFITEFKESYKVRHTNVLHDGPTSRTNPTRINILGELKKLSSKDTKDGMLIFYFAGHGVEVKGEFAVCPRDYSAEVPEYSALRISEIYSATENYTGYRIFIFDCCRQLILEGDRPTNLFAKMPKCSVAAHSGSVAFFSCSSDQVSWETDVFVAKSGFGGLFTHFLMKSFKQNRSKKIRILDAFDRARVEVATYSTEKCMDLQSPSYHGSNMGDYFLAK